MLWLVGKRERVLYLDECQGQSMHKQQTRRRVGTRDPYYKGIVSVLMLTSVRNQTDKGALLLIVHDQPFGVRFTPFSC
jgi:hypothetical protein